MGRRLRMRGLVLVLGVLLVAPACGRSQVLLGANVQYAPGQTRLQSIQALEAKLGRPLGASREFRLWDSPFPTASDIGLRDTGHKIVMSVKARRSNGAMVPWRDIANAAPGSALYQEIVSWGQRIKAFRAPMEFAFHHEPESRVNIGFGTSDEFIGAWRKIVDVFRAQGATNARYLWIMTDSGFLWPPTERRFAPKWYPGDAWVSDLGVDSYNWYQCRPGRAVAWQPSLAASIEPFRRFGLQHPSKGLWLAEWASDEDPANGDRKAAWITATAALMKQPAYAQFKGVTYSDFTEAGLETCNWPLASSAKALAAFRAMAADPYYRSPFAPR